MHALTLKKLMTTGAALLLAGSLAACGGDDGLSGEYGKTEAGQWFTIVNFTSGSELTLTMIGSEDRLSGSYKREGDTVTVTAAGESRGLKIDGKGCLDGGAGNTFFSGTICPKP